MRGKIVNLCIGFMNIAIAVLLMVYTLNVPQDKTLMTVQENTVVGYIVNMIYLMLAVVAVINAIQSYNHRSDTVFNMAYIIGIFCLSFIFIKEPIIAAFSLISGLIIVVKSFKENLVEIDSTTGISISLVLLVASAILTILVLSYQSIVYASTNESTGLRLHLTRQLSSSLTIDSRCCLSRGYFKRLSKYFSLSLSSFLINSWLWIFFKTSNLCSIF